MFRNDSKDEVEEEEEESDIPSLNDEEIVEEEIEENQEDLDQEYEYEEGDQDNINEMRLMNKMKLFNNKNRILVKCNESCKELRYCESGIFTQRGTKVAYVMLICWN
jgi:hypothetical protein